MHPEPELVVRGRQEREGGSDPFVWRFGPAGRYVREITGARAVRSGHDGAVTWIEDAPGRVRPLERGEAESSRLLSLILSGAWSAAGAPLEILSDSVPDTAGTTGVRLRLGRREARLVLDTATGAPRELVLAPSFGTEVWTFSAFGTRGGVPFAETLEQRLPAGVVNRFVVESVERLPASPPDAFRMPPPGHARFEPGAPAELAVEQSANGFLLVRPLIDGREVGPFIFDTGAGANVVTPRAGDSLGLRSIGASWLGLAAGATKGGVRGADSLRLGPLTIEGPWFVELDLDAVSAASGMEIAGIIGYDVLMRAVVEIEVATPRIAVHPPATAARGRREPIVIQENHVYVHGRFEDRDGLFRLDTGAPQVPLIFNAPAVEELKLVEGREVQNAKIGVPGGTMDVAMGSVRWLEIGGHRFDSLAAIFPLQRGGAFDDADTIGNVGQECLRPFRVTFDYARRQSTWTELPSGARSEPSPP